MGVTLPELKRACHKMKWQGDVRMLFDCLDVDRKKSTDASGRRSITLEEISFLDSWQCETEQGEASCTLLEDSFLQSASQMSRQQRPLRRVSTAPHGAQHG